jgi:hypothetical protein
MKQIKEEKLRSLRNIKEEFWKGFGKNIPIIFQIQKQH